MVGDVVGDVVGDAVGDGRGRYSARLLQNFLSSRRIGGGLAIGRRIGIYFYEHVCNSFSEELEPSVCISERGAGTEDCSVVGFNRAFELSPLR